MDGMKRLVFLLVVAGLQFQLIAADSPRTNKAMSPETFGHLPIKELTVFKDGHTLVAHEGDLPTDEQGNVNMDNVPAPVIGTFWAYSAGSQTKLTSVVAGQRRTQVKHTALTVREILEANVGAEAVIAEAGTNRYTATILAIPTRSGRSLRPPALTVRPTPYRKKATSFF